MKPGAFFEWDQRKASRNLELGRPSFESVSRFRFETAITFEDTRADYGEKRMTAIGLLDGRVHVLVYTERDKVVRIISFRNANDREIRRYDRETMGRN
ncbi:MAG: BrnT family toxin [Rhizobiaceae bacterium]|nr:BrnT family toxin [Rhizobiaceae bacterium]